MGRKLDLIKGQKVVIKIEERSNASRRLGTMTLDSIDEWCFDGEVVKIGRKYITVKWGKWSEEQFEIENDYLQKYISGGSDYKLYLNKDEVIKEYEAEKLYNDIKQSFSAYGRNNNKFTLDQLQRISNIINENK